MLIIYLWKGKGTKSTGERRKCHYLLSRLSAAWPFHGAAGVGGCAIPPQFRRLGGWGKPWGGEGHVLWGPVEVLRVREPTTERVLPKALFSPRFWCGLGEEYG